MFVGLIIILFAWFIEMPLWLSITATVLASVHIITRLLFITAGLFSEID